MEKTNLFRVAEIQVSYNPKIKLSQCPQITKSTDIYDLFRSRWDMDRIEFVEQCKMALLNHKMKVIGMYDLSTGGRTGTIVDPRLVFGIALKTNATGVIICHNHPSGNLKANQMDINLTKKLVAGGLLLDISLIDHMIITRDGFYSFDLEGML